MEGGEDGAFLSPVSNLRRAEAEQRRAQQERIRAVPLSRRSDEFAARAKRKQADARGERDSVDRHDAAAHKRRRRSPPESSAREKAPRSEETPRYLSYERAGGDAVATAKMAAADRRTPRELSFSPVEDEKSAMDKESSGRSRVSDGERASGGPRRGSDASSDQEERALPLFSRYKVRYVVNTPTLWTCSSE